MYYVLPYTTHDYIVSLIQKTLIGHLNFFCNVLVSDVHETLFKWQKNGIAVIVTFQKLYK